MQRMLQFWTVGRATDSFTTDSTCSLDYLHSKIHRQFLKVMVRCNFLEKLWGLKITLDWNANGPGRRDELLTVDNLQNTHASNRNNSNP